MIGLLVLPFLLAQQPTVLHPGWSVTARVICRIRKLSLLHPHALRFWLQLWPRLTCKTKPGLVLLLQSLKSSSLACVQTSPLPQENIERGDVILLRRLYTGDSSQHSNSGKPQQRHFFSGKNANKTEEFLQANFGRQINKAHQWRKQLQNVEARTRNFLCYCSYQRLLQTPSIHRLEVQDIFCCFDWLL